MFFEERDEVGDADDVDAGLDAVGEVRQRREHHVAAVGAAVDGHAVRVEVGLLGDPVEQGADVLDAVLALLGVVELQIGLAVAGRAADVRLDHRDAEFVQ